MNTDNLHDTPTGKHAKAIGWVTFLLMLMVSLFFQVTAFSHVGSFWRDEISTVSLVEKPSLAAVYDSLEIDSYPPLYVVLLRGWKSLGPGSTEFGMKLFGFMAFAFILTAVVIAFRRKGTPPPLVATALLAFNPNVFYWSTALRAYGFAAGLIILFFGFMLAMMRRPSRGVVAGCFILAVFCVQSNYQNSYLVLAVCTGGIGVCALRRQWRKAALTLSIGIPAAVSLTPYIPSILRVRQWDTISRMEPSLTFIMGRITSAFSNEQTVIAVVWYCAVSAVILIPLVLEIRHRRQSAESSDRDISIFIFLTALVAVVTLLIFVKCVGYATMPWQYLPFMGLIACLTELLLQRVWPSGRGLLLRIGIACVMALVAVSSVWSQAHLRRTNMDIIAKTLAHDARAEDLIVVSPFYLLVGWGYHNKDIAAEWISLPPVPHDETSRPFPHMKAAMASVNPIEPVLEAVTATLKRGGRVWLVGQFDFLPPNQVPPVLSPAPLPEYGWSFGPYVTTWSMQLGYLLQSHATNGQNVAVSQETPVSPLENLQLIVASGWK